MSDANSPKDIRTMIGRRTVIAGMGAAGLVAGAGRFSIARAAGGSLKVGVLLPRSGYQAGIGQDCQRGVEVAADLLKGLGMPDLEIMDGDTESNVQTARSQAEKLIGEGANVLVGAFDSGQTSAIAQVAEQKGVPLIINIAAAPPIATPPFHGIITVPGTTHFNGGLKIDRDMRVIDVYGQAIPALFAAGEVTGGFHGRGYLSGTHVGMALVFGQIAGRSVVAAA